MVGGRRGAVETAVPFAAFTLAYAVGDELRPALAIGVASAAALLLARLWQRSTTRHVTQALVAIVVAAVVATATGRPEAAFLPGILQSAAWAGALGLSIALRRPAAGFVIGAVLGDPTGWRAHPGMVRLGDRLTLVALAPMLVRLAIQLPLYLTEEVAWLGAARVALGWPLHAAALALAAAVLARGHTPLQPADAGRDSSHTSDTPHESDARSDPDALRARDIPPD